MQEAQPLTRDDRARSRVPSVPTEDQLVVEQGSGIQVFQQPTYPEGEYSPHPIGGEGAAEEASAHR